MIIVILAALGLILGSFVNAMVWRFHEQAELRENAAKKPKTDKDALTLQQLSMVKGRSMCSNCHHELAVKDLVPLFSWLWLQGRCRYCHQKIQDSPLIEVILPVLFVVSYLTWPDALSEVGLYQFVFWLIFLTGFMALAAYDLRWFLLPDRIVFPLIGLAILELVGRFIFYDATWGTLGGAVLGVLVSSGLFYVLYVVSQGGWIGGGDVKLGIIIGILVGSAVPAMLMLFIASTLGTLVALPQLISGKAGRASKLPFGPYLLLATFIVVLYGERIINGYLNLVGLSS